MAEPFVLPGSHPGGCLLQRSLGDLPTSPSLWRGRELRKSHYGVIPHRHAGRAASLLQSGSLLCLGFSAVGADAADVAPYHTDVPE